MEQLRNGLGYRGHNTILAIIKTRRTARGISSVQKTLNKSHVMLKKQTQKEIILCCFFDSENVASNLRDDINTSVCFESVRVVSYRTFDIICFK